MTSKWRRVAKFGNPAWYRVIELEDGWKVRMEFWLWNYKTVDESDVHIALIAYKGPYIRNWTCRKEGRAVGPGGLAVSSAALKLLDEVERVAPTKAKYDSVWMNVSAASLNLYLMYRRLLAKRGYTESFESREEYTPYMIKELR